MKTEFSARGRRIIRERVPSLPFRFAGDAPFRRRSENQRREFLDIFGNISTTKSICFRLGMPGTARPVKHPYRFLAQTMKTASAAPSMRFVLR
jgi:hypothetical protein